MLAGAARKRKREREEAARIVNGIGYVQRIQRPQWRTLYRMIVGEDRAFDREDFEEMITESNARVAAAQRGCDGGNQ